MLVASLLGFSSLALPLSASARATVADILRIRAVPALEGIVFWVDDRRLVTDVNGIAVAKLDFGGSVRVRTRELGLAGDRSRYDFVAWSDGSTNAEREVSVAGRVDIGAGFDVDHLVSWGFTDADGASVDPHHIDRVKVVDSEGTRHELQGFSPGLAGPTAIAWERYPAGSFWLAATTVAYENGTLLEETISYKPKRAVAEDVRISAQSDEYLPESTGSWPVRLSAHMITVSSAGLLLGGKGEKTIELTYPNGRTRIQSLPTSGRVALLPPGRYAARATGPGLALRSTFSVPTSQAVGLKLITYWDLALAAFLVAGLGLVLRLAYGLPIRDGAREVDEADSEQTTLTPAPKPDTDNGSPQRSELIRVYLRDGRSLDGWRRQWDDERVLILDVVASHDNNGELLSPRADDAFLARQEISRIEALDAT